MHRFSSCCWKPCLLPTSLCAQPPQRVSALAHCETLALSLPVLVLSQHPHYDSFHSLGREMLLPCLKPGDPQGRDHRGLEVSPLAHAHLRPYINPAWAWATAATGMQLGRAGFLPGLSREAGNWFHCIRAVTAGGRWDRDVKTQCENEVPAPGLSMGNLLGSPSLNAQGAPMPVNLSMVHP